MGSDGDPVRVCVNDKCRAEYVPFREDGMAVSARGLCPKCDAAILARKAWEIDPELYAECQRINRAEMKLPRGSAVRLARRERAVLGWLAKKPLKINPLEADAYLSDGYTPSATTGKKGGPSGKDA